MPGLPKDQLEALKRALDNQTAPTPVPTPTLPASSPVDLAKVLAGLTAELAKPDDRSVLRDKRAVKRAELAESGRQEGKRDWVSQRVPEPVKADIIGPQRARQAPIPKPVPLAERSDEELYRVLAERWRRYIKVVTEDMDDKKLALANATQIADLLQERGQSEEQIVSFIQSIMQEGGEDT